MRTVSSLGSPYRISRCSGAANCCQGTLRGIRKRRHTVSSTSMSQCCDGPRVHPDRAPSSMLRLGSGTTASGSTSRRMPRPVQAGHAPCGLLNEKLRGAGSSIEMPSYTHAYSCEKSISSSPLSASMGISSSSPSLSLAACSSESLSRELSSGLMTTRSTTTSMSCLNFLSSVIASERSRTSPSMRARANPLRRASSKTSRCSPLRPCTIGAVTISRVPSGSASTWSAICSMDCLPISRPHLGQCGCPMRA